MPLRAKLQASGKAGRGWATSWVPVSPSLVPLGQG